MILYLEVCISLATFRSFKYLHEAVPGLPASQSFSDTLPRPFQLTLQLLGHPAGLTLHPSLIEEGVAVLHFTLYADLAVQNFCSPQPVTSLLQCTEPFVWTHVYLIWQTALIAGACQD